MASKKEAAQAKILAATAKMAKAMTLEPGDEFLTTREAAALTKMSTAYYEKIRWMQVGPPYLKRGKTVRYLKSELMAWWTENSSRI